LEWFTLKMKALGSFEISVTMCLSTTRNIPEATPLEDHDYVPFPLPDMAGQEIQFSKQCVEIPLLSRSDKPLITGLQEILVIFPPGNLPWT
jgi:hypothetical protein